jgi:cell wall-associated NlpC family hydrolase
VSYYNKETYSLLYGDVNALMAITKDVLSEKISIVSKAKVIDSNPTHSVFAYDNYVVEVIFPEKALGEVEGEVHVYKKNTYFSGSKTLAKLYCDTKNASIDEGVVCIYKIKANLADTTAPIIYLSTSDTTLREADSFNPASYVRYISDNFDSNILDYTVSGNNLGKNGDLIIGTHVVTYTTKDSSGNVGSAKLTVRVKANKPKYSNNVASRPYAGTIVSEARSLIGSPYVWGANGPYAFDCSGFVQYVYKRAGIYVPRTSGSQAHYGTAINPYDMSQWQAGDIVTFGPGGSEHAAIYTGNGTLVHALNPAQGVRETSVFGDIYSVRRP